MPLKLHFSSLKYADPGLNKFSGFLHKSHSIPLDIPLFFSLHFPSSAMSSGKQNFIQEIGHNGFLQRYNIFGLFFSSFPIIPKIPFYLLLVATED